MRDSLLVVVVFLSGGLATVLLLGGRVAGLTARQLRGRLALVLVISAALLGLLFWAHHAEGASCTPITTMGRISAVTRRVGLRSYDVMFMTFAAQRGAGNVYTVARWRVGERVLVSGCQEADGWIRQARVSRP